MHVISDSAMSCAYFQEKWVCWGYDKVSLEDYFFQIRTYSLSSFSSPTFIQNILNSSSWSRTRDENECLFTLQPIEG